MRRFLLMSAFFLFEATSLAQSADRKISDAQSDILAPALVEAAPSDALKLPGLRLDGMPSNPKYPHLRYFQAFSSVGQGIVGTYAMDVYTGDAWDLTTCTEIKSRKLERLQRGIRRDIGLSAQRYRQIKVKSPPDCF